MFDNYESSLADDPFDQLKVWLDDANASFSNYGEPVALATSTLNGKPSVRMVNLRSPNRTSLIFFSDYESRKGQELTENPNAALLFFWKPLARQIRIEGKVVKAPSEVSDQYFHEQSRESCLATWVSRQSQQITDRQFLEQRLQKYTSQFEGSLVPRPEYWGAYELIPHVFEFWQERPIRLHDRIQYAQGLDGKWSLTRLSP